MRTRCANKRNAQAVNQSVSQSVSPAKREHQSSNRCDSIYAQPFARSYALRPHRERKSPPGNAVSCSAAFTGPPPNQADLSGTKRHTYIHTPLMPQQLLCFAGAFKEMVLPSMLRCSYLLGVMFPSPPPPPPPLLPPPDFFSCSSISFIRFPLFARGTAARRQASKVASQPASANK